MGATTTQPIEADTSTGARIPAFPGGHPPRPDDGEIETDDRRMIDSGPETRAPLIPTWLSNAAAIGWRVLVVFALIAVLAELAVILGTVVASIVFALIVAVLFAPVATRLRGGAGPGRRRLAP